MGNVLKAQLFKTSKGFYLQELPKKGAGGAQCEMTIGSTWGEGDKLSIKNCEAIENGYDLDEISLSLRKEFEIKYNVGKDIPTRDGYIIRGLDYQVGVIHGFQKALELLGDKKFSEKDVHHALHLMNNQGRLAYIDNALEMVKKSTEQRDNIIQSLKQTEWDVEVEMQEVITDVALDIPGFVYKNYFKPRLDKDGCLILKRI